MGACHGGRTANHVAISKAISKAKREQAKTIRILLLGAGDSGKSTFLKQMKCAHDRLSLADYQTYRRIIRDNLIAAAKGLYIGASREGIDVTSETINTYETIIDVDTRVWTSETIEQLQKLWKDPGIKKVWRCYKLKYHLLWCTNYLFKHAGRIGSSNYRPTEDDIFRARLKTTGVKETTVTVKNDIRITFIDVGGQRSERRKWLDCFDNVDAIIYLVALDEYNMVIEENNTTNRLKESMAVLHEVSGASALRDMDIPFILFLNKFDLFRAKYEYVPLSDYFPKYKGNDWQEGVKFVAGKLHERVEDHRIANTYVSTFFLLFSY
mmetsp:Transcript_12323/g.13637  ORF Transcript_12323/g.13637 Transcript_12323/m.13637 type:complete len:324 (+) Transcript_12323:144-1115(+)